MIILTLVGQWVGVTGGWAFQPADSDSTWAPTEEVEANVRAALAERWGVDPSSLVLDWSQPRGGTLPPGYDKVGLVGHGKDGRWVVSFRKDTGSRSALSVLLRAGVNVPTAIAQHSLQRGEALDQGDMAVELRIHWGSVENLPDPPALGWVAQRRIEEGEVLSEPGVKPPLMVVSGRPVQARWTNGRVELKLQARAMGSGIMGQQVYVRTEDGTRLEAVVQGPGLVLISNSWMEQGK